MGRARAASGGPRRRQRSTCRLTATSSAAAALGANTREHSGHVIASTEGALAGTAAATVLPAQTGVFFEVKLEPAVLLRALLLVLILRPPLRAAAALSEGREAGRVPGGAMPRRGGGGAGGGGNIDTGTEPASRRGLEGAAEWVAVTAAEAAAESGAATENLPAAFRASVHCTVGRSRGANTSGAGVVKAADVLCGRPSDASTSPITAEPPAALAAPAGAGTTLRAFSSRVKSWCLMRSSSRRIKSSSGAPLPLASSSATRLARAASVLLFTAAMAGSDAAVFKPVAARTLACSTTASVSSSSSKAATPSDERADSVRPVNSSRRRLPAIITATEVYTQGESAAFNTPLIVFTSTLQHNAGPCV